jgi:hypothetical protein
MPFRHLTPVLKAIVAESSRKIFGNLPNFTHRTGFKRLKQKPIGPLLNNHFDLTGRDFREKVDRGFMTELEDRRVLSLERKRQKQPSQKTVSKRAKRAAAAKKAAAAPKA